MVKPDMNSLTILRDWNRLMRRHWIWTNKNQKLLLVATSTSLSVGCATGGPYSIYQIWRNTVTLDPAGAVPGSDTYELDPGKQSLILLQLGKVSGPSCPSPLLLSNKLHLRLFPARCPTANITSLRSIRTSIRAYPFLFLTLESAKSPDVTHNRVAGSPAVVLR